MGRLSVVVPSSSHGFGPLRHLWALTASLLPASLFEEIRCVATPLALSQHGSDTHGIAMGVAHIYLLELLLAALVARLCSRSEALNCGRLLLLAGWLNLFGLVAMSLSSLGGVPLYLCGHLTYSLGCMVRDVVFPALTACFPVEDMSQLLAFKRMFVHVGALAGGALIAMNMLRCYIFALALGMGLSLRMLFQILPHLDAMDTAPRPKAKPAPAFTGFWLLIAARFFTSVGIVSTSGIVMLKLFETRAPAEYDYFRHASKLIAGHGVVGHLAGLAVNFFLGWHKVSLGFTFLLVSTLLCILATLSYPMMSTLPQLLLATAVYRGARTVVKAASDALALQSARDLDSRKSAALVSRRVAFKVGQLAGKYSIAPLLALPDGELALQLIFGGGAAMSLVGALLHWPACVQHRRQQASGLPLAAASAPKQGVERLKYLAPRAVVKWLCLGSLSKQCLASHAA
eukprot:CAMPEP_0203873616 /NCGR_PEP_ID=MMETSP0359-20131031/19841_1 /ASSEMBLY_ACC=CAM_ASM_000338 /TAXON_ID=268821 /ORGANISM="Scrippsiella Hangoei, Strain SHTV-5" /LENGTH=457 /DNA_ID=CAMNT_0050792317 /DNA_START=51 /DNA_END=1424 /DNA_ORIENTATION=+